jgi:hypothetical protein
MTLVVVSESEGREKSSVGNAHDGVKNIEGGKTR